jgi:hypothetical protein
LPKIRIISDIAPTKSLTAGIILEQILVQLPAEFDIECEILVDDGLADYKLSDYLNPNSCRWYRKPRESWPLSNFYSPFKKFGELLSAFETKKIVKSIIRRESRNSSDLIIVVIQGQTTIRVANLLFKSNYNLSTIHWDPWNWWHREKGVPNSFLKEVNQLNYSIQLSGSHLVPSQNFREELGLNVQHGIILYPHVGTFVEKAREIASVIRIAFIGQIYSKSEVKDFLQFLEDSNWTFGEKKVELHVYGNSTFPNSTHIVQHGWLNYESIAKGITHCDAAFLPYPRSVEFENVARQSFPSKLATYVTASLPIIYLGPNYSSFATFIEEIGINLEKIPPSLWETSILELLINHDVDESKIREIYDGYFSNNAQRKSISDWLCFYSSSPIEWSSTRIPFHHNTSVRELNRPIKDDLHSIKVGRILYLILKIKTFPLRKSLAIKTKIMRRIRILLRVSSLFFTSGGFNRIRRVVTIMFPNPGIVIGLIKNRKV